MKPIIFNTEMVKAILDGRKTQTRRVIKNQPTFNCVKKFEDGHFSFWNTFDKIKVWSEAYICPYGKVGDRLEVFLSDAHIKQKANPKRCALETVLEITDIRVERVQEINEEDVIREGVEFKELLGCSYHVVCNCCEKKEYKREFKKLWESIYGKDAWERNDWVWVIEFKRIGVGE